MNSWLMPVLLSALLGPGVGQLYNREIKKGMVLLGVGLVLVVAMSVWLSRSLMPYLTSDVTGMDVIQLAELSQKVREGLSPSSSRPMLVLYMGLVGIWIYSIIDAYYGSKPRRSSEKEP